MCTDIYIYIYMGKYTDMCMDIYIYVYTGIMVYLYIYVYMCVYIWYPPKKCNVSVFYWYLQCFYIILADIFEGLIVFFTHCYSSLFWQQYMVGFQGDNINNIITYILYKYIATDNFLEHLLEKHFLSTLGAMFKNIRKSPQLEHPKTLQHTYINIYWHHYIYMNTKLTITCGDPHT